MSTSAIVRVIAHETRGDHAVLYPLGDVHVGAMGCDEAAFSRYVSAIAEDPAAYWVGLGDYLDAINVRDPRWETDCLAPWMVTAEYLRDPVTAQRDRYLDLTRPIWPKCLAMIEGNHEFAIAKHWARDVYREIVGAIQPATADPSVPLALGYEGFLRMKFQRPRDDERRARGGAPTETLDLYLHHGNGGGRLKGAKALALGRLGGWFGADVIIMGHVHDELATPVHRVYLDRAGNVKKRRIATMTSGTFLDSYADEGAGYAERVLLSPGGIGTGYLELRPWVQQTTGGKVTEGFDLRESIKVVQ